MAVPSDERVGRFQTSVAVLERLFRDKRLDDDDVNSELHAWLDGDSDPLPWSSPSAVTPDEWFFVSTLYGEMSMDGQRTHIRKCFPSLFVSAGLRDIRNFVPGMPEYAGLRSRWMSQRLSRMGEILRGRGQSMSDYTEELRRLGAAATPDNPLPALDQLIRDHHATGWKTLSVFVRDCVGGNSFPIDSRVEKSLREFGLPADERFLVGLCLTLGKNPRRMARMFYEAGGAPDTGASER